MRLRPFCGEMGVENCYFSPTQIYRKNLEQAVHLERNRVLARID